MVLLVAQQLSVETWSIIFDSFTYIFRTQVINTEYRF